MLKAIHCPPRFNVPSRRPFGQRPRALVGGASNSADQVRAILQPNFVAYGQLVRYNHPGPRPEVTRPTFRRRLAARPRASVIENRIINSTFTQPTWDFRFDDDGITNEIEEPRRVGACFVPIGQPKKKGKQLIPDTEWTKDGVEENGFINRARSRGATGAAHASRGRLPAARLLDQHRP